MNSKLPKLRKVFSIDLRSLAIFRMALGALLLVDLIYRARYLEMLFLDAGILPKEAVIEAYGSSIPWTSLHFHTAGSASLQITMLLLAAAAAVSLLVGYRTLLATIISWVLFISVNRRIPATCYGFDDVMRLMLLWSFFLPLGARWSVDSRRKRPTSFMGNELGNEYCSVATVAILLQVCYIYLFTAIWKVHPDWLEGRALQYALETDYTTRPLAHWLAQKRWITVLATYLTLAIEFVVPFIALSPWNNTVARWIAIGSMWTMHLGIWLCLHIGLFPPIAMAYWVLFIPAGTWDFIARRPVQRAAENTVESIAPSGRFLPGVFSKASKIVVVVLLIQVTAYNVFGLPQVSRAGFRLPGAFNRMTQLMRIDQTWKLYAPTPNVRDGWLIMPAILADGSTQDVWLNEPVSYEKPAVVSDTFRDFRVNMLFMHSIAKKDSPVWPWVAKYVARKWNATQPPERQVERLQIIFIGEQQHNGSTYLIPKTEYDAMKDAVLPISAGPIGRTVIPSGGRRVKE